MLGVWVTQGRRLAFCAKYAEASRAVGQAEEGLGFRVTRCLGL